MREHKVLLVTGASSELGRNLIRRISCNYDVIWAHCNQNIEALDELKSEIGDKLVPVKADFSSEKETRIMIEKIVKAEDWPDNIVHLSSPKAEYKQFHKYQWERYEQEINVSFRSITMILEGLLPQMCQNHYGKIVFVLTSLLTVTPPKYQSPYICVKYALLGLMKNIASEYAARGIFVNGVSPNMIETKFLSNIPGIVVEQSALNNPIERNITIDEVLSIIEYLLSEGSGCLTGQNISITGGIV